MQFYYEASLVKEKIDFEVLDELIDRLAIEKDVPNLLMMSEGQDDKNLSLKIRNHLKTLEKELEEKGETIEMNYLPEKYYLSHNPLLREYIENLGGMLGPAIMQQNKEEDEGEEGEEEGEKKEKENEEEKVEEEAA
jgi:hypothetical protein